MNKFKFLVALLLLLLNILDLYTTYISGTTLETETSPIISWFGYDWNFFILYKMFFSIIIIIIFFYVNDSILIEKEKKFLKCISTFKDYISCIFTGKQMNLWKTFNSKNFDIRIFFSVFFQILPISMILMMFMASINNILTIYNISVFKQIPTKNVIHIVALSNFVLIIFLFFLFLYKRYKKLMNNARP